MNCITIIFDNIEVYHNIISEKYATYHSSVLIKDINSLVFEIHPRYITKRHEKVCVRFLSFQPFCRTLVGINIVSVCLPCLFCFPWQRSDDSSFNLVLMTPLCVEWLCCIDDSPPSPFVVCCSTSTELNFFFKALIYCVHH